MSATHRAPAEQRTLALLDRIAGRVVERAAPVRFAVAAGARGREAAYRLRYAVVVAEGWARPADLPDGLERDEDDDRAIQIIGWVEGRAVATTRVVLPGEAPLPTERAFAIAVEPAGGVVDVGRFAVDRSHAGSGHRTFAGLLGFAWLEARRHGYRRMCGAFTPAMIELFRRMGFQVRTLGPAASYWGEERHPILVDVVASSEALARRWS